MGLEHFLQETLETQGEMSFACFMQHALYHPQYGYYNAGLQKFGAQGDFITAPELTPLFGQTLAIQVDAIFKTLETPSLLEFGAGTGRLCVDLLSHLEKLENPPKTYSIMELSGSLRKRQQDYIHEHLPHWFGRIHWLDTWPEEPFRGVMLGNEVLDAMPVERFLKNEEGLFLSQVLFKNNQWIEQFRPCTDERMQAHLHPILPKLPIPYLSEVNLFLDGWLQQCFACLAQGALLLIDYGFPQHEYYHPDRNQGTLMCHYHHHAHPDPFIHIGEQDITAHVDFTHVAWAAQKAGFHVAGYTDQASFLMSAGLLDLIEHLPEGALRFTTLQAIKRLLQPSEMGELYKVIGLTKNLDLPLLGFQLRDKRVSL